jgi:hypothetical protein
LGDLKLVFKTTVKMMSSPKNTFTSIMPTPYRA